METLFIITLYLILSVGCVVYFYRNELEDTVDHKKIVQLSILGITIFLLPAIYACILYIAINTEHIELLESELFFLAFTNIPIISTIAIFRKYHLNNVIGYVAFVFIAQWFLNTYTQQQFKGAYFNIIINNNSGDDVEPIMPFPNEKRYKHVKIALLYLEKSRAIYKEEHRRKYHALHSYIPVEGQDSIWIHFRFEIDKYEIDEKIMKEWTDRIGYSIKYAKVSPVGWISSLEKEVRRPHEGKKLERNNIIQGEEFLGHASKVYILDDETISDSYSDSAFTLLFKEAVILFVLFLWTGLILEIKQSISKTMSSEEEEE